MVEDGFQTGDIITIKVNGVPYKTYIDDRGVQRFYQNEVIAYLFDTNQLSLNDLIVAYQDKKFDKKSYAEFNMMLGYSVSGFRELSSFEDWEIENPIWEEKPKKKPKKLKKKNCRMVSLGLSYCDCHGWCL